MPVYGYKRTVVVPESGLLEMREVSFALCPRDLRRVAAFLHHYADLIDADEWHSDHVHIDWFDRDWPKDQPDLDILVLQDRKDDPPRCGFEAG